jgi:uncharacterized membrane protein
MLVFWPTFFLWLCTANLYSILVRRTTASVIFISRYAPHRHIKNIAIRIPALVPIYVEALHHFIFWQHLQKHTFPKQLIYIYKKTLDGKNNSSNYRCRRLCARV